MSNSPLPSIYLLRHGQSEANVAHLIVSNPTIGCSSYGLTDTGREKVRASAKAFVQEHSAATRSDIAVVSSDFLRAKETAEIFASEVGFPAESIQYDTRLRERWFGSFDMANDGSYKKMWEKDADGDSLDSIGAESTDSVAARSMAAVKDHVKGGHKAVVFVSHGDVLQILQTALLDMPPSQHRTAVDNIDPGDLRRVDPRVNLGE
ncbi:hypothetical protein FOL47_003666 [Perkinsus chesapeaki]|uniref:Phosphoglycerate mutase n=1 Tax=Perkinsus chesapeaki TaxID=330153 RepID=A0A7J6M6X6_PERCH|nr:hypothetical protein FOL47_003666 [Perkinsus chesapeaki]